MIKRLQRAPLSQKILLANSLIVAVGAIAGTVITVWHVLSYPDDLHYELIAFFAVSGGLVSFVVNNWVLKRTLTPLDRLQAGVDAVRQGRRDVQVVAPPVSDERFDRLIEIAARLREGRPNLRVLIAGEGPLRADLQAEIDRRDLQSIVQLVGFILDLPQIIGDADVFLLTSDDEGTPNVLLEAMAARVACVAFAVGAVPEIFTGPLAAGIIEPGNTEAMARWTAMLLDDSDLREAVAREMEMHALLEFSLDASMRRFETLFGQLADAAS